MIKTWAHWRYMNFTVAPKSASAVLHKLMFLLILFSIFFVRCRLTFDFSDILLLFSHWIYIFIWCLHFGLLQFSSFSFLMLFQQMEYIRLLYGTQCLLKFDHIATYFPAHCFPAFAFCILSCVFAFVFVNMSVCTSFRLIFIASHYAFSGVPLNLNMRFNGSLIWEEATMLFDLFSLRPVYNV